MSRTPRPGPPRSARGKPRVPERGHVVWIDFEPQTGREQANRRPALVLSPASYNGPVGLAIVCPTTNQAKGYPFEVPLPHGHATTGVLLSDQIKSLDWRARNAEYRETLPDNLVRAVVEKAVLLIDPDEGASEERS